LLLFEKKQNCPKNNREAHASLMACRSLYYDSKIIEIVSTDFSSKDSIQIFSHIQRQLNVWQMNDQVLIENLFRFQTFLILFLDFHFQFLKMVL